LAGNLRRHYAPFAAISSESYQGSFLIASIDSAPLKAWSKVVENDLKSFHLDRFDVRKEKINKRQTC